MEKIRRLSEEIETDYRGKLSSVETIQACLDKYRELEQIAAIALSYCSLSASVDYSDASRAVYRKHAQKSTGKRGFLRQNGLPDHLYLSLILHIINCRFLPNILGGDLSTFLFFAVGGRSK